MRCLKHALKSGSPVGVVYRGAQAGWRIAHHIFCVTVTIKAKYET